MSKLIVLSPFLYYPGVPHGGGALCWGQLEGLAKRHEVHFLSFIQPGSAENETALPHLCALCASVTTVDQRLTKVQVLRSKIGLFTQLEPVVASLCTSGEMLKALKALLAKVKADAVFIQFPHMAQYVDACGGVATVMDVQDAFSVSAYRRYKAEKRWAVKMIELLSWLAWVRYESCWYARFSVTAALTQQDRTGLEIFSPGLSAITSPAAVAIPDIAWSGAGKNTIAFLGSFSHLPNVDALHFFIRDVFPKVLAEVPDAVFSVAGKGVPADIEALASEHIRIVGMVPDAFEFVCSASVVVIPLRSGGGIKIKTLEALAGGCPIVATSIGAEETGAESGTHLVVADTADAFASAVVAVLRDAELARRIGANGRELAKSTFSWEAKWSSLNNLIDLAIVRSSEKST